MDDECQDGDQVMARSGAPADPATRAAMAQAFSKNAALMNASHPGHAAAVEVYRQFLNRNNAASTV